MNYKILEPIVRSAVCKALGAKIENLDRWIETYEDDIKVDDLDIDSWTIVGICFDPPISPFRYFSSEVVFYVSVQDNGLGDVQVHFGDTCADTELADRAASSFFERDAEDGWYICQVFEEDCGLHLMREFECDPEDTSDVFAKITSCLSELCDPDISDKLRSFIHYFED